MWISETFNCNSHGEQVTRCVSYWSFSVWTLASFAEMSSADGFMFGFWTWTGRMPEWRWIKQCSGEVVSWFARKGSTSGDLKLLTAQTRSLYLCSLYHTWSSHPAVTCFSFWSAAELLCFECPWSCFFFIFFFVCWLAVLESCWSSSF